MPSAVEEYLHCRAQPAGDSNAGISYSDFVVGLAIPSATTGNFTTEQLAELCAIHIFNVDNPVRKTMRELVGVNWGSGPVDRSIGCIAKLTSTESLELPSKTVQSFWGDNSTWKNRLQKDRTQTVIYSFVNTDGSQQSTPNVVPSSVKKWDVVHIGVLSGREHGRVGPSCDLAYQAVFHEDEAQRKPWAIKAISTLMSTTHIRFADYVEAHVRDTEMLAPKWQLDRVKAIEDVFLGILNLHFSEFGNRGLLLEVDPLQTGSGLFLGMK